LLRQCARQLFHIDTDTIERSPIDRKSAADCPAFIGVRAAAPLVNFERFCASFFLDQSVAFYCFCSRCSRI
jgi:hypothetical protein